MVDSTFEKTGAETVRITKYFPASELKSKPELEALKIKLQAEIAEIDSALEVFK